MVQKIEELGSELDIEGVRNSLDLVVLQQGRIEIYKSRTDQRIPPQISAKRDWIWHGEAFRFDVVVRVPMVDERTAARGRNQVWDINVRIDTFYA